MTEASRPARARARSGRRAFALVTAMMLVVTVGAAAAGADDSGGGHGDGGLLHAWITPFAMSPTTGPPGTVVHVSGSGCAPGLLSSPSTDFVTVAAGTLDLAFRAPVASNGSWQGSFTVPTDSGGLPAVVVALCTSGSLPSLLTVYTPLTFTVSLPVVPPTVPVVPTTLPVLPPPVTVPPTTIAPDPPTPPSTVPHRSGGGSGGSNKKKTRPPASTPGTTGGVPGTIFIGTPGDTGLPAGGGVPGGSSAIGAAADATRSGGRTVSAVRTRAKGHSAAAPLPADLGTASLAAHSAGSSDGLGWLAWALLALVVVAAVGAPALLWSRRQTNVARPGGEAA